MRWHTSMFELAALRGWSDRDLARLLGVNYVTIWRYRKGRCVPSTPMLQRQAALFGRAGADLWWPEPLGGAA